MYETKMIRKIQASAFEEDNCQKSSANTIKFDSISAKSPSLKGIALCSEGLNFPIEYFIARKGTFCDLVRKIYNDCQGRRWLDFAEVLFDKTLIEIKVTRNCSGHGVKYFYDIA